MQALFSAIQVVFLLLMFADVGVERQTNLHTMTWIKDYQKVKSFYLVAD